VVGDKKKGGGNNNTVWMLGTQVYTNRGVNAEPRIIFRSDTFVVKKNNGRGNIARKSSCDTAFFLLFSCFFLWGTIAKNENQENEKENENERK